MKPRTLGRVMRKALRTFPAVVVTETLQMPIHKLTTGSTFAGRPAARG